MKYTKFFLAHTLIVTLALSTGCPSGPPAPKGEEAPSDPEESTTADEMAGSSAETAKQADDEAKPADDAEAVAKLKEAGVVFVLDDQGVAVEANCKPAQMTNELMALLEGVPHLRKLNLENGQFENDALAVLEHLQGLTYLNLRQCSKIDAEGLVHLKKVPQLERLLLLYTRTDDEALKHVGELKNLIVLDLRGTKIGDEGVQQLTGLNKLVDLKIRAPNVTGESMATIGKLTKLRYLALEDASVGDENIGKLAPLKDLVSFNIMRTYVSDEGLSHFSEQKFRDVRFRDTAVSGAGLDALTGSVETLEYLDLSETLIDNAGVAHIAPFTNLQTLLLWNGTMDDDGLQPLTKLTKLKSLDIHGCRLLTSACVEHLLQFKELETLNIAQTNLDDEGLLQLGELENLREISVGQTGVTSDGIEAFKAKRPNCQVNE